MIIGVMSDTHGNRGLMHRIADDLVRESHADIILHLGDGYDDGEELIAAGHNVRIVPGLYCREYRDKDTPNTLVENFDGAKVACAHAEQDLRAKELCAAVILTGHTHEAMIEKIGRSLYVNPGHLKATPSRGEHPSYAVIEIADGLVRAAIHETNGRVRTEQSIPEPELG
jgi:uncharacterized protein